MRARWTLCVLLVPLCAVGCGSGGISGSALADCIGATGREALFEKNEFLVYDTVKVRTTDNRARIDLWDDAGKAKESHESEQFDAGPEERARFALVDNAEVTWDEVPSAEDDSAVMTCLDES